MKTVLTAVVISCWCATAIAQDTRQDAGLQRLAAGSPLTIIDTDGHASRGVLTALSAASLSVLVDGTPLVVPRHRIGRVTLNDSRRNGALIGAVIGGGIGVLGGWAMGSLCANETGRCEGVVLGIVGLGIGAGAGIGYAGDALNERVVYDAMPYYPHRFTPEVVVGVSADSRGATHDLGPAAFTGSWGMRHVSGLGFEFDGTKSVANHRTAGASTNAGVSSVGARAVYFFSSGRVQPYAHGGIALQEVSQWRTVQDTDFRTGQPATPDAILHVRGISPTLGGGARLVLSPHVSIRPDVTYTLAEGYGRGLRVGAGVGFRW